MMRYAKLFSSRCCLYVCQAVGRITRQAQQEAEQQMLAAAPELLEAGNAGNGITHEDMQNDMHDQMLRAISAYIPPGTTVAKTGMLVAPSGQPVMGPHGMPLHHNQLPKGICLPEQRPTGVMGALHDMSNFNLQDAGWRATFSGPKDLCGLVIFGPVSCFSPTVYFAFRAFLTMVWFGVICRSWDVWHATETKFEPGGHPPWIKWWIYTTHQSAIINLLYFIAVTFCTGMVAFTKRPEGMGKSTPWFVKIALVFSALAPCVAVMATLGFFLPQMIGSSDLVFDDLSMLLHTLNLVLLFTDFTYSRLPTYFSHAWLPTVYALAYIAFTYLYYLAGGTDYKGNHYIYNFLNWGQEGEAPPMLNFVEGGVLLVSPVIYSCILLLLRAVGNLGCIWRQPLPGQIPQEHPHLIKSKGWLKRLHRHRHMPRFNKAGIPWDPDRDRVKDYFDDAKDHVEDFKDLVELG
jgi:hypothetical protein